MTNLDFWMPLYYPLHIIVQHLCGPYPDPVYCLYKALTNVMDICKKFENEIYYAEHVNKMEIYEKYVEEYVNKLTYFFKLYNETYVNTTIWIKSYKGWLWRSPKYDLWKEFVDYMEKEKVPELKKHSLNRECIEAIEVNRLQLYNDWKWMNVREVILASQKEGNLFNKLPSELVRNICEYVQ
jgi:hypothetical protein